MLRLTEIELWPQDEAIRIYSSSGSVFHGALMECVGEETASALHTMSLRPYSQYICYDKDKGCTVWRIGTINDDAYECIVRPVLAKSFLYLKQKHLAVKLGNHRTAAETSFSQMADTAFCDGQVPSGCRISFLTTASFKHDKQYDIFPTLSRLFYSLLMRWNQYSPEISLEQSGLENVLAQSCRIVKYDLRSQPFSLEGRDIYGFGGLVHLRFTGNDMTSRLAALLLSMAPYTGIGIKTALGMGAVQTRLVYRNAR